MTTEPEGQKELNAQRLHESLKLEERRTKMLGRRQKLYAHERYAVDQKDRKRVVVHGRSEIKRILNRRWRRQVRSQVRWNLRPQAGMS
jgi:hypothetical protein